MADWHATTGSAPAFVGESVVAIIGGGADAQALVARIGSLSSTSTLAQLLDLVIAGGTIEAVPPFFVAARDGSQWRCAVRGTVAVTIDGAEAITGESVATWHEFRIPSDSSLEVRVPNAIVDPWQPVRDGPMIVGALRWAGQSASAAAEPSVTPAVDPASTLAGPPHDLDPTSSPTAALIEPSVDAAVGPARSSSRYDDLFGEFTVAGGVAAAAVDDHEPTTDHEGTTEQEPTEATDTASDFDHSAVAVSAVLCAHQHPNPPERSQCWRCSASLASRSIVRVPRPSLGTIALDDGRVLEIDRTLLLGRNPRAERTDAAHLPALISVGSDAAGVSRTHARIFLDGWQVLVEDLGSTFGSSLIAPDGGTRRLRPGQPELVSGDTVLDLGGGIRLRILGVP